MKKLGFVYFVVCASVAAAGLAPSARASDKFRIGIAGGFDWTLFDGLDPTFGSFLENGFGYSGSLMLTFFQNNWIGFSIYEDAIYINTSSATDSFTSHAFFTGVTPMFSWGKEGSRHSLGVGYGFGYFYQPTASVSSALTPQTAHAISIVGKDSWKLGPGNLFVVTHAYVVPVFNGLYYSIDTPISIMLGYEF